MILLPERLMSHAMLVFKDRLITVLCNSPHHEEEVAVVELSSVHSSYEGAVCVRDLVQFAGMINMDTSSLFVREQSDSVMELWIFAKRDVGFDDDPTPVNMAV